MAFMTVGEVQMFYEDLGKPDDHHVARIHWHRSR